MQIRIVGTELPGRHCAGDDTFPGYSNVHVGVLGKHPRGEIDRSVDRDDARAPDDGR